MKALKILLAFLFLLPGLQFAVAQDAPDGAWTGVTVLIADGWRYRDVTVYLDPFGAGVWVQRGDGAERLVSIDRVVRIIGPDGEDITDAVLAGKRAGTPPPPPRATPEPRTESWDGAYEPAAVVTTGPALPARPFELAFTLEGGYGFPVGDRFDSFDPSWTAGARLRIGASRNSYLGFGYRHQDLGTTAIFADGLSAHLAIYEGTFGWMSDAVDNRPRSYFELGASVMELIVTFDDEGFSSRYSDKRGAFVFRAGVLVPLGAGFGFDLGASCTYSGLIFTEENELDGSVVGVHFGLTWLN